jgi:hypothetical protein
VDPTTPTSTEIPFPSASSIDDPSAPPSAPPDSSNHWVVGALDKVTHTPEEMPLGALDPAASRNDATPRTPTDEVS